MSITWAVHFKHSSCSYPETCHFQLIMPISAHILEITVDHDSIDECWCKKKKKNIYNQTSCWLISLTPHSLFAGRHTVSLMTRPQIGKHVWSNANNSVFSVFFGSKLPFSYQTTLDFATLKTKHNQDILNFDLGNYYFLPGGGTISLWSWVINLFCPSFYKKFCSPCWPMQKKLAPGSEKEFCPPLE